VLTLDYYSGEKDSQLIFGETISYENEK